ncbi:MAG: cytochrome P450, partial [Chloroflexia bacterium]
PERGEIDLAVEAREITFDIAAAALSGFATGEHVDNLRNIFYNLMHGFDDSDLPFEELMQDFFAAREKLISVLVTMIRQRRAAAPEERPRDVLSQIVHARDEEGNALSDEQVLGHLNILLIAGHETTTTLSTWALYLLSTMPEHRERLLNELTASMEGNTEPSIEAIRSLKHMDNFIRETGRMYPPVVNVPRGVVEDVEFEGYTIPKGTIVRLGLAATHYLPSVWTDPLTFDPDRLAPPREEDKRTPYSLVTFGGGPRVCIGQHFAMIETKALIAHVLHNYHMEPATKKKPVHAGFFNSFIPGGLPMKVRSLQAHQL